MTNYLTQLWEYQLDSPWNLLRDMWKIKKMIPTIGRSNSADRVLGVIVDRKLCNLSLSSLELQQRGQCSIGGRQLAKSSVILLNGTKIIICGMHSAALETHQETRLKQVQLSSSAEMIAICKGKKKPIWNVFYTYTCT